MLSKLSKKESFFIVSIVIVLLANFSFSFKAPIILDEIFYKLSSINHHHKHIPKEFAIDHQSYIIKVNDYINDLEIKGERSFFKEVKVYLNNISNIGNIGPLFPVISKLPLIRSNNIWGLRLLNFIFFTFGLIVFYCFLKEINLKRESRLFTILVSSLSFFSYTIIQHGRIYAIAFCFLNLFLYLSIKLFKEKNLNKIIFTLSLILLSIHLSFLNYYFYIIYLPTLTIAIAIYCLQNKDELKITSDYFWQKFIAILLLIASLAIYIPIVKDCFDHPASKGIRHGYHYSLDIFLLKLAKIYPILISNSLKFGISLVIFLIIILASIKFLKLKKSLSFYLIIFFIPFSLMLVDLLMTTQFSLKYRYIFVCLPAVFVIYGFLYEAKPKITALVSFLIFIPAYFIPAIRNKIPLRLYQWEEINAAKKLRLKNENSKILVVNNNYYLGRKIKFAKYLIENLEKQNALFNQETDKSYYMTTKQAIKVEEILDFIKKRDIDEVFFVIRSELFRASNRNEFEDAMKQIALIKDNVEDVDLMVFKEKNWIPL